MIQRRVLILVAVTISLLAFPMALQAQETDPASLCYNVEAFHAGDFDTVLSNWAEDAVQTIVVGDSVDTYSGKDEIRAYWEGLLANGFRMEIQVQSVEGNTVTVESKTWTNDTEALGVAPLVGTEVCVVQDGKIQSMTWTITDESLAALGAAMAALPTTGGEPAPAHIWVVWLGGLIIAAGLVVGHQHRRERHLL